MDAVEEIENENGSPLITKIVEVKVIGPPIPNDASNKSSSTSLIYNPEVKKWINFKSSKHKNSKLRELVPDSFLSKVVESCVKPIPKVL